MNRNVNSEEGLHSCGYHDGKRATQPAQEPVAWYDKHGMITHDPFEGVTALYTTPPQRTWVGLTDEEIRDCLGPEAVRIPPGWSKLTRAIEAKLKEKNND